MSELLTPMFFEDNPEPSTSRAKKTLSAAQRKSLRLKNIENQKIKTEVREKKLVHRKLENIANKIIKIKELIDANENEHDLFGKQVAASLKLLPLPLSIQLQKQIQDVINEFNQTHDISVPINMMSCTQNENREDEVEAPEPPTNDHNALDAPIVRQKIRLPWLQNLMPSSQQIQMLPLNTQQAMKYLSTNTAQLIGQKFVLSQCQKPLVLEVGPLNSLALKPLVTDPSTAVDTEEAKLEDDDDSSEDEEIEIKEEPIGGINYDEDDPLQALG